MVKNKVMKRTTKTGTLLIMIIGLFMIACEKNNIGPSANVTIQEANVSDFTGLEVSSAFVVDVTFSTDEDRVEIEANSNLHQYIEVTKVGNNLRIQIKNNTNFRGNTTLKAHIITSNPLNYIAAAGACNIGFKNKLVTNDLEVSLSGASHLIGETEANTITAYVEGASGLNLTGQAGRISADLTGASQISGFEMIAGEINLIMEGACQAGLTVNDIINLDADGASVLSYKGNAFIDRLQLTGGSQIVKVD